MGASDAEEEPPGEGPAHWSFGTTADVGIAARAADLSGLLEELAQALVELITDRASLEPVGRHTFSLTAENDEELVVAFLEEVLYWQDAFGWLPRTVRVEPIPPGRREVRGEALGETLDPRRHPLRLGVKAATLHRLQVSPDRRRARVILDI